MKAPFRLERYLASLRDCTAWAPDLPLEDLHCARIPRPMLHRIGHLWALALLDDRFDTLLLPVLATGSPLLDCLDRESRAAEWGLPRDFFYERLDSGACLLLIDGPESEAATWPRNRCFFADGR